jgi:excisionase family DNA binding protein
MKSPYLTLKEAAEYARVSIRTIQRRIEAGELNRYGTGHPLVHEEELEALLSPTPVDILEEKS